jgi:hypothetical protein
MADKRISHARGKGSLSHNNRNFIYKNVDPSRTKDNIYYAKESLDEAYHKCFGQALEDYNAKQKRADRKIDDYYTHLFGKARKDVVATSTNKEKSFYEIAVGVGDKNTCPVGSADGELAAKILDEYAKGYSERNPNFYVFNSVMHLDEKTPHLHIDYIPIADGYKNGLSVRNSQSVALQNMGFGKAKDSINEWRKRERQALRELCQKHGLEIAEETQGRGKTFTPDEYKRIRDEAKEELKADPDVLDELKEDLRVDIEGELEHKVEMLAAADEKLTALDEQLTQKENRVEKLTDREKNIQERIKSIEDSGQMLTLKQLEKMETRIHAPLVGKPGVILSEEDEKSLRKMAMSTAKANEEVKKYKSIVKVVIEAIRDIIQAVWLLKFNFKGDKKPVTNLTPEQDVLIAAIYGHGVEVSKSHGYNKLAEEMNKATMTKPMSEKYHRLEKEYLDKNKPSFDEVMQAAALEAKAHNERNNSARSISRERKNRGEVL